MPGHTAETIAWLAFWFVAGVGVFAMTIDTLRRAGFTRPNFQDRLIPIGAGIGFALLAILIVPAYTLLRPESWPMSALLLALVAGFGLLGFMDDCTRDREKGGFAGHLRRFVKEQTMSTALLKASFGFFLALGVALALRRAPVALADAAVIALCANAVNLLDVRPGRALKGFSAAFLIILGGSCLLSAFHLASVSPFTWAMLVPFVLWGLAFARYDLSCGAMMGDAGSNVLGAVLGFLCVTELSDRSRLVVLALLIAFHILTERASLSAIIDGFAPLRWADRLFVRPAAERNDEKPPAQ